ncbi:MAG: cation diffusion facilitator family transporter [Clostridia bacterium]|nr:cation diffusion facilitator family transporter [Clostridia bacterium]
MIKLLVKRFIPDSENTSLPNVRERYGVLGGALGIVCNILLFLLKLIIGLVSGSIAIVSDSFNNLSDCGSSLVALFGAKLSNRRPDSEHPFGHGRSEYVASLIVAFITMILGFELLKGSVGKIAEPSVMLLTPVMTVILLLSVLVKVWMYSYNKYLGEKINSSVLLASAKDSISDVFATLAIIIASVTAKLFELPVIDGIIGLLVSLLIIRTGFGVAMDTIGLLLGKPPEKETVQKINEMVLSGEGICGVHDLVVHDYGPGRAFASVHAEVPDDYDIVRIHEIIDALEHKITEETGIHMVIHMDPVAVDCERTNMIKAQVIAVIKSYDERLNIHDFRMTDGENRINLIFDLETPQDLLDGKKDVASDIAVLLAEVDNRYKAVINVDRIYG